MVSVVQMITVHVILVIPVSIVNFQFVIIKIQLHQQFVQVMEIAPHQIIVNASQHIKESIAIYL